MTAIFSGIVMVAAAVVLWSRWMAGLAIDDITLLYVMVGILAFAVLGREIADRTVSAQE